MPEPLLIEVPLERTVDYLLAGGWIEEWTDDPDILGAALSAVIDAWIREPFGQTLGRAGDGR